MNKLRKTISLALIILGITCYSFASASEITGGLSNQGIIPVAPSGVTAVKTGDREITISWNAVAGVDGYKIYRQKDSGNFNLIPGDITVLTYKDGGLNDGKYSYKVQSFKGTLSSDPDNILPTVPVNVVTPTSTPTPSPAPTSDGGGGGGGGGSSSGNTITSILPPQPTVVNNDKPEENLTGNVNSSDEEKVIVLGVEADYRDIQLQQILTDAGSVWFGDVNLIIANAGVARNSEKEADGRNKYTLKLINGVNGLTNSNIYAITNFIVYGTKSTQKLGAGERAGVLNSYKSAFGKLPATESEWQDAIKIANGRWPSEKSEAAENKAKSEFKKTYKRDSNMNNPNDNAAVTIMAYGLRPSDRNTESEKAAIKIFKAIYHYNPASATDWDAVRAIAYSGAVR